MGPVKSSAKKIHGDYVLTKKSEKYGILLNFIPVHVKIAKLKKPVL